MKGMTSILRTLILSIFLAKGCVLLSNSAVKIGKLNFLMSQITDEFQSLGDIGSIFDNQYDKLFKIAKEYPKGFVKTYFTVNVGFYTITNYNLYDILVEQMGLLEKYQVPGEPAPAPAPTPTPEPTRY